MWERVFSKTYQNISKDKVWSLWTDVNNWPTWHGDLEYCKLSGEFKEGNSFILKPKGAPAVKITLIKIKDKVSFTDCTHFFGARMYDTHEIEETQEGLKLTNRLYVTGPLKYLWIFLVAKKVADTVPEEMDNLVSLARTRQLEHS